MKRVWRKDVRLVEMVVLVVLVDRVERSRECFDYGVGGERWHGRGKGEEHVPAGGEFDTWIHVHPETPVSLVSYIFYSLPYLSSFYITPSEPHTIEFYSCVYERDGRGCCGERGTGSGLTSMIPGTSVSASASASARMTGSRNTSSIGKRRNMELGMQIGDQEIVMPILGW
ncbi:hypothetical protein K435DRAFT_798475 [Dendrothele bispora CBS 962.96]|uniref:Uncharacterized protein n=1 Tax=Dendrothele bispora (strain CBS 962.96) TaxID=1314807 RepID=A0A4S8LZ37_DENBC|nr:hypothetical protein K435DRAFT_798475 [Dendrothele bispora CBS 962.96]